MQIQIFITKTHWSLLQTLPSNAELNEDRLSCVNSLRIPSGLVKKYESQNFPNDEKTKCYVKCILSKMGYFDESNGFSIPPEAIETSEESAGSRRIIADKLKKYSFNHGKYMSMGLPWFWMFQKRWSNIGFINWIDSQSLVQWTIISTISCILCCYIESYKQSKVVILLICMFRWR